MEEVIRSLFRGEMEVFEPRYSEESRQSQAFIQVEDLGLEMKEKIPEEYHPVLEQYEKAMMELMDAACEDDYVLGYKTGIRLLLAAWPQGGA